MIWLSIALAQTTSLRAQTTSQLYRDPIDLALEPATLGTVQGRHLYGVLARYQESTGDGGRTLELATVRPFGPGVLSVHAGGGLSNSTLDASETVDNATSGSFVGDQSGLAQAWVAWGNGRFGFAVGSQFRQVGQTARATVRGMPSPATAEYDDDTDIGAITLTEFQQDLVIGLLLSGNTELDLLYRYSLEQTYVEATVFDGDVRFDTKGLYEGAGLDGNHQGHGGGIRLDTTVDRGEGRALRVLVELRAGSHGPSTDTLIDVEETDGVVTYRRDLAWSDARLLSTDAFALVASHRPMGPLQLRYGVTATWTGDTGAWEVTSTELDANGEQTTQAVDHRLTARRGSLALPVAVEVPLRPEVSLWTGARFTQTLRSRQLVSAFEGNEEQQSSTSFSQGTTVAYLGARIEPTDALQLDLVSSVGGTINLNLSGSWRF